MGVFKSSRQFSTHLRDLVPVVEDVERHFREQAFEVAKEPTIIGGWHIDIHKGGVFKAVFGLKTSLKIEIEPNAEGFLVKAGVGIFGAQALPTMIMFLVAWPVLFTQIWGMVKQAKLDDEALDVIEQSLDKLSIADRKGTSLEPSRMLGRFCTNCGHSLNGKAKFCGECGSRLT